MFLHSWSCIAIKLKEPKIPIYCVTYIIYKINSYVHISPERRNSFTFSVIQCYPHSPNPSHPKKNGCNGDGGGWLYNGRGDEKFLKSVYIVGRGVLTPYFMKTTLYCLPPLFQILSTPSPTSLSPPRG